VYPSFVINIDSTSLPLGGLYPPIGFSFDMSGNDIGHSPFWSLIFFFKSGSWDRLKRFLPLSCNPGCGPSCLPPQGVLSFFHRWLVHLKLLFPSPTCSWCFFPRVFFPSTFFTGFFYPLCMEIETFPISGYISAEVSRCTCQVVTEQSYVFSSDVYSFQHRQN